MGLDQSVVEQLLTVLTNNSVEAISEVLGPDSAAVKELTQLMTLAESYGIVDWIVFDASVVRGLAYYTGIVFEAFDRKGELRAIAGGGRYDKLLETFGGEPTPAVGFGFGDAVIVELLKERNVLPSFGTSGVETVVFAFNEDLYGAAIQATSTLRKAGLKVDLIMEKKKPKWVFKYADRLKANHVVLIAPDEWSNDQVSIKNLSNGEQVNVEISALADWALSEVVK